MSDDLEHRGISRKTFLMYFLQLPLLGGIAKYLYGFKPQQRYLLNKFSVAGLTFYKGTELINIMKSGETLTMNPKPTNPHDKYAVELYYKEQMIGHIPRTDNKLIFRLIDQGKELVCTIREIDPDVEAWRMCKVKVELVG